MSYGLKNCHDPVNAIVDVVFVHGLTGNRETTWTDKASDVFWPAHLLKNDTPNARIMTFGYDADVVHFWSMASQNRIRDHAVNLVNALAQLRERSGTEERPIIFVTHSLGGLVFEDAMLASKNSAETHIQRVYDATHGVCFLGTPHCGSKVANWASIFGQIMNVVKRTNTSLLSYLQPESEVLRLIQEEFHTMLRSRRDQGRMDLRITCFYEELPVRGVGEIVPKDSAILPAYNYIGIHNNHMDMTKFNCDKDSGYLAVSAEILRWVREIQEQPASRLQGFPWQGSYTQSSPSPLSLPIPQRERGGNVVSGTVHNYGGGKAYKCPSQNEFWPGVGFRLDLSAFIVDFDKSTRSLIAFLKLTHITGFELRSQVGIAQDVTTSDVVGGEPQVHMRRSVWVGSACAQAEGKIRVQQSDCRFRRVLLK
ncbi:hypothetical protein B0I35DRAFT_404883 [Stachybotrys elegans]|uniref:DUF676 domain-containing protein n=1 Tax=Stachybotrys elegans TaxID=80388 RepID=A0A8K0WZ96_9HYPO|nr:hypothetical protein B0I35DRAFT_404883 [Stachybotrys elegans]